MSPRFNNFIDPVKARRYKRKLGTWRAVGEQLAREEKREVPYQPQSVRAAARREAYQR